MNRCSVLEKNNNMIKMNADADFPIKIPIAEHVFLSSFHKINIHMKGLLQEHVVFMYLKYEHAMLVLIPKG